MIDLVLFGMVVLVPMRILYAWWLHHRLRTRHPLIYEELGSPRLFANWRLSRRGWLELFIFSSQGFYLNDPDLTKGVIVGRTLYVASLMWGMCLMWMYYRRHS
jgi:hypothetical protein